MVENFNDIEKLVLDFVIKQHEHTYRKYTGDPYWHHLVDVALIVRESKGFNRDTKAKPHRLAVYIALCHDLFKDTSCGPLELIDFLMETCKFSVRDAVFICNCVVDLTDEFTKKDYPLLNRKQRKKLEGRRLRGINSTSGLVKLADMINNTEDIVEHDPDFAKVYLKEKQDILTRLTPMCGHMQLMDKAQKVLNKSLNELK